MLSSWRPRSAPPPPARSMRQGPARPPTDARVAAQRPDLGLVVVGQPRRAVLVALLLRQGRAAAGAAGECVGGRVLPQRAAGGWGAPTEGRPGMRSGAAGRARRTSAARAPRSACLLLPSRLCPLLPPAPPPGPPPPPPTWMWLASMFTE